jgi:hypothetical protein
MKKLNKILITLLLLVMGGVAMAQQPQTTVEVTPKPIAKSVTGNNVCPTFDGAITIMGAEAGVLYNVYTSTGYIAGTSTPVATGTPSATVDYGITIPAAALTIQPGTNTFIVTGTRYPGCTVNMSNPVNIEVNPSPNVTIGSNKNELCEGDQIELTVTLIAGIPSGTQKWSFEYNDGILHNIITDGSSPHKFNLAPVNGPTTYIITSVTDGNGCIRTSW